MTIDELVDHGPDRAEGLTFRYRLHMAASMVRANPRSARTFLSVAIATFSLLLSFAAINAMATLMTDSARDVISGDVMAFADGYDYSMLNPRSDVVYYLSDAEALTQDLLASGMVDAERPRINVGAQLSTGDADAGVLLIGADFAAEGYELVEGVEPRRAGEICINPTQRGDLGLEVGDAVTLAVAGAPLDASIIDGRVTCVFDNGRFGLFRSTHVVMPLDELQRILDRQDAVSQLLLTLPAGSDPGLAADELGHAFEAARFSSAEETADLIFTIQTAQRAVMWGLVVVTAIICAILIANVVGFALRRERWEIATMRTMGFDAPSLRTVYALQTLIVGGTMIAVGTAVAVVAVWIVGLIGIPIGRGEQLFGDDTLRPWLGVTDIVLTAALMLGALVLANLLSTRTVLSRSPLEITREG